MPNWEPAADRGLWALSDPRLSNPAKMRKKYCGSICSSLSPSPVHLSHTTNITLSRIKCERYIFYKEVCSFVHWSRRCVWLCFCIYLYMYMYAAIKQYQLCDSCAIKQYLTMICNNPDKFTSAKLRKILNYQTKNIYRQKKKKKRKKKKQTHTNPRSHHYWK